mgnify:CR=1 FL=1
MTSQNFYIIDGHPVVFDCASCDIPLTTNDEVYTVETRFKGTDSTGEITVKEKICEDCFHETD